MFATGSTSVIVSRMQAKNHVTNSALGALIDPAGEAVVERPPFPEVPEESEEPVPDAGEAHAAGQEGHLRGVTAGGEEDEEQRRPPRAEAAFDHRAEHPGPIEVEDQVQRVAVEQRAGEQSMELTRGDVRVGEERIAVQAGPPGDRRGQG
jgi:hypothetical protein